MPTPHSPLGAHASFDFGPPGEPAAIRIGTQPAQPIDVFVGCRASASEPWSLLPFFNAKPGGPSPLPKGRFGRFVALASDKWMIGPLVFKLCTPFAADTDSTDEKLRYAPVVCGYLEYDNSHSGDTAELVFGLGLSGAPLHSASVSGFTFADRFGFVTAASPECQPRSDAAIFSADIGTAAALHFTVPPASKRIFPLVLGFFAPGYFYGRWFADLPAVLAFGLESHDRFIALADARDAEFMRSTKPFEVKTRLAASVRDWLFASRRLADEPPVDLAPLREM